MHLLLRYGCGRKGWVNEDVIRRHGLPPSATMRVLVCGLPSVYDKISGPRNSEDLTKDCALSQLGYTKDMVIKL